MPGVGLFFQGVLAGVTGAAGTSAALASIIGGSYASGVAIGAFATSTLGSLLITTAATALSSRRDQQPRIEDSRVNVRLENADRWTAWGTCAVGGALGPFMEHDGDGNFWFIVAHYDGELVGEPTYLLDGVQVQLSDGTDGFTAGDVLTDDFCLTDDFVQYEGSGTRLPIWRIYTVTPDGGAAFGDLPAAFTAAFPSLPADFKGAGVVFSVVRGKALPPEHRFKAYRWRGGIGIGEPSVTLVGNAGRFYDPRDPSHDIDDPATWTASDGNPAIVWAGFRTSDRGKGQPMASIDWAAVATAADRCDSTILDRAGDPVPRYRCGIAFPDSLSRGAAEQEILRSMDGFVAMTPEGKAYPVPGYYVAPTVILTAARDLFALEEDAVDNGEAPMDGVICEYISPDLGWVQVESAPWVNADRYDGVSEPNYDRITVRSCQSHTQAVLLAKAHGERSQAARRAGLEVGLRGVHLISARAVNLDVDGIWAGAHEIVTPVQEDPSGTRFGFAVVPLTANRWNLLAGEEGEPPQPPPSLDIDDGLESVASAVLTAESVATSAGQAVRLKVTFDPPSRVDRFFAFRFAVDGVAPQVWEYFVTDMDEGQAVSRIVADGAAYDVQVQTRTAGGRATEWAAVGTITATADTVAPGALAAASGAGGAGQSTASWTTANDPRQASVAIYHRSINTKPASPTSIRQAGPNSTGSFALTGLTPGTWYLWLAPRNGSGVEGATSGSYTVIVT